MAKWIHCAKCQRLTKPESLSLADLCFQCETAEEIRAEGEIRERLRQLILEEARKQMKAWEERNGRVD